MEIIIKGSAKEIADFVLAVQSQPKTIEEKIVEDLNKALNPVL